MGCEFLVILRIGGRCEYLTVTRSEIEEDGGDAVPVGGIAGPERARQFDPTDPCHRCRETLGSQPPQFGVCGDREQPRALPGTPRRNGDAHHAAGFLPLENVSRRRQSGELDRCAMAILGRHVHD